VGRILGQKLREQLKELSRAHARHLRRRRHVCCGRELCKIG
jgi:hypothetical protein